MRRGGSSSNALPGSCVASSCSLPLFFCFSFFAASRLRVKNIGRTRLPALTLTAEHRLTSLKTEYWLSHSRVFEKLVGFGAKTGLVLAISFHLRATIRTNLVY
jgi:hypothetical protein